MRYRGGAIGHKSSRSIDKYLTRGLDSEATSALDLSIPDNEADLAPLPRSSTYSTSDDSSSDDDDELSDDTHDEESDDLGFDDL